MTHNLSRNAARPAHPPAEHLLRGPRPL